MALRILLLALLPSTCRAQDEEASHVWVPVVADKTASQRGSRKKHEKRQRNERHMLSDMSQPALEVSAKYNVDGWCAFGFLGSWASTCAVSRRTRNARIFAKQYEGIYATYLNVSRATPVALHLPDNRTLVIRDHEYPLDDLYCYVNGWYSLPRRAEVVSNFSYLEELSESSCDHLAKIVPAYYNLSMADMGVETLSDQAILDGLMNSGATQGYVSRSLTEPTTAPTTAPTEPTLEDILHRNEDGSGDELLEEPGGKVLLTRRGGVSAEPSYADWIRPVYPKTVEQRDTLTAALKECPLFQGIEREVPMFETFDDELIARITDIDRRFYKKGSRIIVQGQKIVPRGQKPIEGQTVPAELYIVLSGECAVSLLVDQVGSDQMEQEEHVVRRYGPGERFGELAFINRTDRAASVTASTDTELLCLDRDTFERLVELELKQRENYASDPRKALADFYSSGDQTGPGGVAKTPGKTQWFAVYRPTRDALAKMLNQTAVGKGLNVKLG
eukprot:Skav229009  [mRNA]  locus=scaffold127:404915:422372:- [translate_table: standard]